MALSEIIVFIALCYLVYLGFAPVRRNLERFLLRWFRRGSKGNHRTVIDITESSKHTQNSNPKEGS